MKIRLTYSFTIFTVLLLFLSSFSGFAQGSLNPWSAVPKPDFSQKEPLIHARNAEYFNLDFEGIHQEVLSGGEGTVIAIPLSDGRIKHFKLMENTLLALGLNSKFPEVAAFDLVSLSSNSVWGKFDISPKGIHAMIFQPGKSTVYIDPLFSDDDSQYIAYAKNDFYTDKAMECFTGAASGKLEPSIQKSGSDYNDCQLRTYRVAIAATGEYTMFQGGSAADAFDAMVTTMNRVNGVYEREFGVTMTMVSNTDELIFINPLEDPYTNGSPGQMIGENQETVDLIVGNDNYDIGHVFGTNSGGLAGLGVTCFDGDKARGVTGSSAPVGDPFDIDYVAHEMGHQFGGNHSFNNACGGNRNDETAVEPGSGVTIMGYAGICPPNIAQNSDDFFHGINMEEIGIQITNNTCQVNSTTGNTSPEIADLPETVYLPVSTPFALSATATDVDGDSLTYCWEQTDTEISSQPPLAANTGGPSFRSLQPTVDSTRYFPGLEALANGGPFTWERLPSVAREMNFRLSIRDNVAGGGCTQYTDIATQFVGDSGPFVVLYPSEPAIEWQGFDYETVTWDVANTTADPINAQTVDIFLSTDGGDSYPVQLADDVENLGSFSVQVPNIATSDARIMVMNSEGTFFDISNNDFTITTIESGFTLASDTLEYTLCQDAVADMQFSIASIGGFADTIDFAISSLPDNAEAALNTDQGLAGDTLTVSLTSLVNTAPGIYPLVVTGIGGDFTNDITFTLTVVSASPIAALPLLPEDQEAHVSTYPVLEWTDNAGPLETYTVEVATDAAFNDVIVTESGLEENTYALSTLSAETTYYWRIINSTLCGVSEPSEAFSFTTFACGLQEPEDLPLTISDTEASSITSSMEVIESGVVADVNVVDLQGDHSNTSNLSFTLTSAMGTQVELASSLCGLNMTIAQNGNISINGMDNEETISSSGAAGFGPGIPGGGLTSTGVLAQDGSANPNELCNAATNASALDGNIALIYRGNCNFTEKVLNAQNAGAIAAVIINNIAGDGFFDMGGNSNSITIPSVMISLEDGNTLVDIASMISADFDLSFDDEAPNAVTDCPATTGATYQPEEVLSLFNGENAQGTWTLSVADNTATDGGQLNSWRLEICYTGEGVGLNESTPDIAQIYPNPTDQKLNIVIKSGVEARQVRVYDLVGRLVKSEEVSNRQRVGLDLSEIPSGVYLVRIAGSDFTSKTYKIVKL